MAYQPQTYQDGVTEYTDTIFQHMDDGIFGAYPVQLIAISSTAPSTCAKDDKYYNSTSKKIFTATATNTWGSTGTTPLEDTAYWLISENGNYAWDGTDLVSIGGGKAEVIISDTEPSDGKLWVDTDTIQVVAGKENLVNVGTSVDDTFKTNLIKSKNLFDKNNYNSLTGYIGPTVQVITQPGSGVKILYIPCKPNTTYTIQKIASKRFSLGTTRIIPATGVNYYDLVSGSTSTTELTITTESQAKYLIVEYYISGSANPDTLTEQEIANTIMINQGSEALPYEPYVVPSINVDGEEIYNRNQVVPTILWQNSSPTSNFAGQDVSLIDSINNYSFYEVIFRRSTGNASSYSSGRIPTGLNTELTLFAQVFYVRTLNFSGSTATFGDGRGYTTYNSSSYNTVNNGLIPYMILGYK